MGDLVDIADAAKALRLSSAAIAQMEPGIGEEGYVPSYLGLLLSGAEDWIARICGTAFKVETRTEHLKGGLPFLLPALAPVVAVSKIEDTFANDAEVSSSLYALRGRFIWQEPRSDANVWSPGALRYKVTLTSGYNDGNGESPPEGSIAAPDVLSAAVLALFRRAYEVRGGDIGISTQGVNVSWDNLASGEVWNWIQSVRYERM